MALPASKALTSLSTCTSPVSVSTSTSASVVPQASVQKWSHSPVSGSGGERSRANCPWPTISFFIRMPAVEATSSKATERSGSSRTKIRPSAADSSSGVACNSGAAASNRIDRTSRAASITAFPAE